MTKDLLLTNSELSDFKECRRKWWLTVYRELGPRDGWQFNRPTTIGTMFHAALEAYYGRGEDPVAWCQEKYARDIIEITDTLPEMEQALLLRDLEKEQDLVVTMVEGYVQWLEEEAPDEDLEVLGAEQHVRLELVPGIELQGKIDAPARWRNATDFLLQLEHKTVGSLLDIPKIAQVNPQFLTYDLLSYLKTRQEGKGERTDGVIINMARKVKRTARANPPFFGRYEVRHNENELRSHWKHVIGTAREIQRTYERLDGGEDPQYVVPPTPVKDCTWKCVFAKPCLSGMFDDGSDIEGYLAANYVHRDPLERYSEREGLEVDGTE